MQLYSLLEKEAVYDIYLRIIEELEKKDVLILPFDEIVNSVQQKIGEGSFGKVFKGNLNGKSVAIKIANSKLQDHEQIQEFLKEIIIVMELKSSFLLQLKGVCFDIKNQFCFVTELMSSSLYSAIYESEEWIQVSVKQKIEIALQIAYGIQDLHHHPNQIIHRDLKPENILLDRNLSVKIADFGMSRFTGGQNKQMKFNSQKVGTIQYMAPELFQNVQIGPAVDI